MRPPGWRYGPDAGGDHVLAVAFERDLGYQVLWSRKLLRWYLQAAVPGYLGTIAILTAAILALPFKAAFMFRPGFIQPVKGVRSKTAWYQAVYNVLAPIAPLLTITTLRPLSRIRST